MKDFENKKPTRFALRTLDAFSSALLNLLCHQRLEDITVGKICDETNYPRSTFYNYFEDIFDLLRYCWKRIYEEIDLPDFADIPQPIRTVTMFDKVYTYLDGHRDIFEKIILHNAQDGLMMQSLSRYIKETMMSFFEPFPIKTDKISSAMLVEHYSNTVQMVLSWCFLRKNCISKKEAVDALTLLLGGLEKKLNE